MKAHLIAGLIAAAMVAAGAVACGGDSNSGSGGSGGSPPGTPSTTPPGAVNTTTITIANNATSPKDIIVARGSQVTFVNSDSRAHDMQSNPHPAHTDCPELAQAGFLNPGQSRQTGNLNTARICGYHDHNADTVVGLQGTITIQ
jgi:plastocyanin